MKSVIGIWISTNHVKISLNLYLTKTSQSYPVLSKPVLVQRSKNKNKIARKSQKEKSLRTSLSGSIYVNKRSLSTMLSTIPGPKNKKMSPSTRCDVSKSLIQEQALQQISAHTSLQETGVVTSRHG